MVSKKEASLTNINREIRYRVLITLAKDMKEAKQPSLSKHHKGKLSSTKNYMKTVLFSDEFKATFS